jgi:membrane protease YdiL (CAAX protease family)
MSDRRRWLAPWPGPTTRSQQWSVRYALTVLMAAWVASGVVVVLLWLVGVRVPGDASPLIIEAMFLASLVPLYRSGSLRAVDLGLRRVPGARSVGYVLLGLLAYSGFDVLWNALVHPAPPSGDFAGVADQGTAVIVLAGFLAVVGAPVVEEVFFRGFLYRSFRNRLGIVSSCVIAGTLFGLGHTQYPLVVRPELAFFGVVACLLYERTGSLLPGIAMHSFVDASGFDAGLTGTDQVVVAVFLLLAVILLVLPPLRGLGRLLRGRPVFHPDGQPIGGRAGGPPLASGDLCRCQRRAT